MALIVGGVAVGKNNAPDDSYEPSDTSGFNCPYLAAAAQAGDLNAQRTYEELCE